MHGNKGGITFNNGIKYFFMAYPKKYLYIFQILLLMTEYSFVSLGRSNGEGKNVNDCVLISP